MFRPALCVAIAFVVVSCALDWDAYDPRLGAGSGGSGTGGAAAGAGGVAGSGGVPMGGSGGSGGGTVESPMPIYRSVGPGNDQPLAEGSAGELSIAGTSASFASALPDIVGVGDVIQYDSDDDGTVDALAFIQGRSSATDYEVRDASGDTPTAVSGDADWAILRAYTALADAEAGVENSAIAASLRDFDAWSGGKDLVAADQLWNIACYADATENLPVVVAGWTTSAENRLRIFTPTDPSMVGVSQRHDGTAGSGYVVNTSSAPPPLTHVITIASDHVTLEGVEVTGWINEPMDNSWEGVHVESSGVLLSDLIVHDDQSPNTLNPNSDGINFNAMTAGDTVTVRNSIVYNIGRGGMLYQGAEAIVVTIENCTVVNTGTSGMNADGQAGIAFPGGAAPVVTVTNTISVGVDVDSAAFTKVGDDWGSSSNNLSSDASAPGPDSLTGVAAASLFVDTSLGIEDFHLDAGAVAIDAGVELPDFLRDIDGELRQAGAWDIGADEQL